MVNYGINNPIASNEGECPLSIYPSKRHIWIRCRNVGHSITEYRCDTCGSVHTIDVSD